MKHNKSNNIDMYVIKRSGKKEIISFDKILHRIKSICKIHNIKNIIYAQLTMKIIDQLHDNIHTTKIDELSAEQCASMSSNHPNYATLAGAIAISNLHKNTNQSFHDTILELYN